MNAEEAIAHLTEAELSPSTVHLLALEAIRSGVDWLDAEEAERVVDEILGEYAHAAASQSWRGTDS